MAEGNVFSKPGFWILFVIGIVIALYMYGVKKIGDKSELGQARISLVSLRQDLQNCNAENQNRASSIATLEDQIKTQNTTISELNKSISELRDSLYLILSTPPPVVTKYEDRVIYTERPEPYHQYGKGNGRLLVYTSCTTGYIRVWIDGQYWGELKSHYNDNFTPECNQTDGTLTNILSAGSHRIEAEDQSSNSKWSSYITISEDQCYKDRLTCN